MEFDETMFPTTLDAALEDGQFLDPFIDLHQHTQNEKTSEISSNQKNQQMRKQSFYPTPTSSSMLPGGEEKQFMSPFPTTYQTIPNTGTANNFADLEELLFTPMMSPAMTPVQQYYGSQRTTEVDWEQFDQNMFALTGSAMDALHNPSLDQFNANQHMVGSEQPTKKQRVSATGSRTPRQTSPSMKLGSTYHHKRTGSMAALPSRPSSERGLSSRESTSDAMSPVDLDQNHNGREPVERPSTVGDGSASHRFQPITPSMLMSLQSTAEPRRASQNLVVETTATPLPDLSLDAQMMPSPTFLPPSNTSRSVGTPRSQAILLNREVRPRPIASAHSKTRSVTSSPALGPQRCKPSPDIRPILPGGMSPQVGALLASKSNYQHIVDGTCDQVNINYPQGMTQGLEVRRTSHKAAEQKRRDNLKECFEALRTILPDRPDPGASKVAILQKGYDHILELQATLRLRDEKIAQLERAFKEGSKTDMADDKPEMLCDADASSE